MKKSTQLTLQVLGGIFIGMFVAWPLFFETGDWGRFPFWVKVGVMVVLGLVTLWYMMRHRSKDKTKLEVKFW